MAMGVVVMPMIQARASGVLFTRQPDAADQEAAFINAVWGLGRYAVGGVINPDHYLVAYQPPGQVLAQTIPPKEVMLVCRPQGGEEEVPVPPEHGQRPLPGPGPDYPTGGTGPPPWRPISPNPRTWSGPWMKPGPSGCSRAGLLQLPPPKTPEPPARTLKDYAVLIDHGTVACRGVGAGPVFLVRRDADLKNFPAGSVLVARHTSTKYVTVMPQTAAILTDAGSPTGHMALLAREFQVPTILNTGNATQILEPGQVVTVDANYNNVYDGLIPELLEPRHKKNDLADSPVFQTLKPVVKKIVPLNLINPEDEAAFSPATLPHHPRHRALRPRIFHAGNVPPDGK